MRYCVSPLRLCSILRHATCYRSLVSFESIAKDDGYTRSVHCKPQCKEIMLNGKVVKAFTGLVDGSSEPLGDQFVTLQMKLTYKHDLDLAAVFSWIRSYVKQQNKLRQIVTPAAVQHLGLDLAVAHMICKIGGRVQFVGNEKWFFRYAGLHSGLPSRYAGDLHLESIDLSGTNVVYEGFELFPQLTELRNLRLRRCMHVNDFCLSRVGRITGLTLLDIGECPRLTAKGLASLTQLKSLRHLLVHNNPMMENKELACLMLEDHLPKLYVDGVDYLDALPDHAQCNIAKLITDGSPVPISDSVRTEEGRQVVDPSIDTDDHIRQRALN
ncbi:unnamed protein product [Dicrocoelium dendriticum]|nr:unnamed protein product [Dicrocoelium dendriticum]